MNIEKPKAYYDDRMQKELTLLGLLGYALHIDYMKNICFIIKDGENVGTIKYKKLHNKNKKKDLPAIYGYEVDIESDKISCHYTRKDGENDLYYEFDILDNGIKHSHVELSLDNSISLNIWNEKYGFFDFSLDKEHIYFSFPSKTNNLNVKETVSYGFCDDNVNSNAKEYYYQIDVSKGENILHLSTNPDTISLQISGKDYIEEYSVDRVDICQRKFIGNKLTSANQVRVIGTASDMLKKHKMGIDSFNHFRYLLDKILPFEKEFVEYLISNNKSLFYLEPFVPDINDMKNSFVFTKK